MTIRPAQTADAPALAAIYRPYVEHTAITFEYEAPDAEEFKRRIRQTMQRFPYLVACATDSFGNEQILGYAYASPFKTRAAYDWSAETSIYVREDNLGTGVGTALYEALEEHLTLQHICNVCACITYPNPRSIAFHERHGYKTVAHFHASGYKLGKWHDMIWMEKTLAPHNTPPAAFIPWPDLDKPFNHNTKEKIT